MLSAEYSFCMYIVIDLSHVVKSRCKFDKPVREACLTLQNKKKGRDLTQSYDKRPNTHRKIQKAT